MSCALPVRVLLWAGVAHADVEIAVRAELEPAAAVIAAARRRCREDLAQRPAGVVAEIRRGEALEEAVDEVAVHR